MKPQISGCKGIYVGVMDSRSEMKHLLDNVLLNWDGTNKRPVSFSIFDKIELQGRVLQIEVDNLRLFQHDEIACKTLCQKFRRKVMEAD